MRLLAPLLTAALLAACGSVAKAPPVARPSATPSPTSEPTPAPGTTTEPGALAATGTPSPGSSSSPTPISLPTGPPTTAPLALGIATTDRKVLEPLVALWNRRGGLGGREVAPVWATDCAQLGQVDLALLAVGKVPEGCPAVPTLSADVLLGDADDLKQAPALTSLVGLTVDDRVRLLLTKALTPSTGALGVVVEACAADQRAVARTLTPLAKQRGFTVAATASVPCGKAETSGAAVAALQAKEAKQVVFVSGGDEARMLRAFAKAAQAKRFAPLYGVTSAAVPSTATDQRDRVVGVGWVPSLDLTAATASAAVNTCLRDLRAAGVARPATGAERYAAYRACDLLRFADAVLRAGKGTWSRDAVRAQGRGFRSAVLLEGATDVSTRQAAPAVARTFAWSTACRCVEYTGNRFPL